MDSSVVLVEREGPIATVTLNRPETRNALNRALVEALGGALNECARDQSVRAMILTGAGQAFCSGADLKGAVAGDDDRDLSTRMESFHALIIAIVKAPKPVIAAVDGAAVGFGADLALACDLRVLSSRAYIQEKFVKIGLMPDGGGTFWMPRLVGLGRAMEYLLLGEPIDARLAAEVGLANRVVPPEDLMVTARELAAKLAKGPPLAHAKIKAAVLASGSGSVFDALAREKAGQLELLSSKDLMEGVLAWAERRDPRFQGH